MKQILSNDIINSIYAHPREMSFIQYIRRARAAWLFK